MAFNENLNIFLKEFLVYNRYGFSAMASLGIKGLQGNNKFGQIISFDITDGRLPVWEEGTLYPYPTSAVTPSIASTDADDTLLGTGAQKVVVVGNDADGNPQQEEAEMDGQNPVALTKSYSRIYRAYVSQTGTSGTAKGVIRVGELPFTLGIPNVTTYAQIFNGNNQTQMAIFTVPKGYTCFVTSITYTVVAGKPVIFHDEARFKGSVFDTTKPFRNTRTIYVENTYTLQLEPYGKFPEHADLQVTALATQNGSSSEVAFRYILIPNTLLEELGV